MQLSPSTIFYNEGLLYNTCAHVLFCCAARFNFGKALWYFPRATAPHSWTIQQMQVRAMAR